MHGTKFLLGIFSAIAITLSTPITHADQSNLLTLRDAAKLCENDGPSAAKYLPNLRAAAVDVRKALCLGSGSQDDVFRAFVDFLIDNRTEWFEPYGKFAEGADPLDIVLEDALATEVVDSYAPFTVSVSPDDNVTVNGSVFRPTDISNCPEEGCGPIFDELKSFYTYAQNTIASPGAQAVANNLADLSTLWDSYLKDSRSQTPLELVANSWWYRRNSSSAFGPPPKGQIIILHPGVVIENVSDALEGQQTQEALMIEILGYNRWQHSRPYAITGARVCSLL